MQRPDSVRAPAWEDVGLRARSLGFSNEQAQIDPTTGDLWFFQDGSLYALRGDIVAPLFTPPGVGPGRLIHFTSDGNVLVSRRDSGLVLLLDRQGRTVSEFGLPDSVYAQRWGLAERDGRTYMGTYVLRDVAARPWANVYFSDDYCRTWRRAWAFPGYQHVHYVRFDPFSGDLYVTVGDSPVSAYVMRAGDRAFRPVLGESDGLMSVGFHRGLVCIGTDMPADNRVDFFLAGERSASVRTFSHLIPYGLASVGGHLVGALRLPEFHPRRRLREQGLYLLPWMEKLASVDAFGFTDVVGGRAYTSQSDDTVEIANIG